MTPDIAKVCACTGAHGAGSAWQCHLYGRVDRSAARIGPDARGHRCHQAELGCFRKTDLEDKLKARGVTQVVVTGVVTSGGVEATARQAYEQGFNVTLTLDAMTDLREEAQAYSIWNVFPRLGETGAAEEIVSMLEKRSVHA